MTEGERMAEVSDMSLPVFDRDVPRLPQMPEGRLSADLYTWVWRGGRTVEGDRFDSWVLIDGSSRIFAKVSVPLGADEYVHRVVFLLGPDLDKDDFQFMELGPAQRFALETVVAAKSDKGKTVEPEAVPAKTTA